MKIDFIVRNKQAGIHKEDMFNKIICSFEGEGTRQYLRSIQSSTPKPFKTHITVSSTLTSEGKEQFTTHYNLEKCDFTDIFDKNNFDTWYTYMLKRQKYTFEELEQVRENIEILKEAISKVDFDKEYVYITLN